MYPFSRRTLLNSTPLAGGLTSLLAADPRALRAQPPDRSPGIQPNAVDGKCRSDTPANSRVSGGRPWNVTDSLDQGKRR